MFRNLSRLWSDSAQPPVDVPRGTSRVLEDKAGRGTGEEEVAVAEVDEELEHRPAGVDTCGHHGQHEKVRRSSVDQWPASPCCSD